VTRNNFNNCTLLADVGIKDPPAEEVYRRLAGGGTEERKGE